MVRFTCLEVCSSMSNGVLIASSAVPSSQTVSQGVALKSRWDLTLWEYYKPRPWDPGMLESYLADLSSPQRAMYTEK